MASSLNYTPGATTPNEVIAKLSATGTICLFTLQPVDLVVDVAGELGPTPDYVPLVPAGCSTPAPVNRPSTTNSRAKESALPVSTLELPIVGRGGVSGGAVAAVVNVTAVNATTAGFVTVFPCDAPRPLASSLNYTPGATTPNEVIAKLSATGTICLFTLQPVDLVVDVTGVAA